MRVWQINGFSLENLHLVKTLSTTLKNNQVRVKIHACSINYRDLMVVRGQYNPKQSLPLIPLSDCAGEVVAMGDLVSDFKVGDKVCATFSQNWCHGAPTKAVGNATLGSPNNGVLAEECDFYEKGLVHFPPYLSYEEASTLPCAGVTAYNALACQGRFFAGNTVLLQGTGGVSIFALQFAKAMGLRIIIISSSDQKLQKAKALGADELINYSDDKEWHTNVLKLTNSLGVDGVIDVGGAKTIGHSILSCKPSGVVCIIGVLSGSEETMDLRPVLMKNLRLQGIFVGAKTVFLAMNELLIQHKIHPVIDEIFNFEEANKAFSYFESAKHFGKVVIRVS
jgi:NADPH:quinone reductase-like Zn-dependent oxidoreductase